ncbi:phosphatase PAP2 family protein [Halomonas dongshanensis]|uniref:undecaprenyl-diphosphate phosphatase n=1 Tax=Halomonas dongshanensis TaxID=2890835 RepID=A0ABT2EFL4_9GAMM|nr:phosphatase PAP2 family protein [Halomonas dongshanensis]MCS2610376.1 phosphatase PAP2 family protein [Halomonas dongshanensis]
MRPRPLVVFDRLDLLEWQFCQRVSRFSLFAPWRRTLQAASHLGDWPAWVALIAAQPWLQADGSQRLVQYALTALIAIAVYRFIKTRLCRERPFITYREGILCSAPARDRYSFPSGHTMHAMLFSLLVAAHTPWLLPVVLPLAVLIAISRVGLGLHYVSDVIAGALMGAGFASLSLVVMG